MKKKPLLLLCLAVGFVIIIGFYFKTHLQDKITMSHQLTNSAKQCDNDGSIAVLAVKAYPKLLPDYYIHPVNVKNPPVVEAAYLDKKTGNWVVHAYYMGQFSSETYDWFQVDSCRKKVICAEMVARPYAQPPLPFCTYQ